MTLLNGDSVVIFCYDLQFLSKVVVYVILLFLDTLLYYNNFPLLILLIRV